MGEEGEGRNQPLEIYMYIIEYSFTIIENLTMWPCCTSHPFLRHPLPFPSHADLSFSSPTNFFTASPIMTSFFPAHA